MKKIIRLLNKYQTLLLTFILTTISLASFLYFMQDEKNLLYADAISRLNIARKVIDNLTPGLAQLGNVWLPLPQILMLPFIWNNLLWQSGIAGYIMSGFMYVVGGIFIYKASKLLTNSVIASIFGLTIYALNVNAVYLQTTAMSESIFMCSLAATIFFFIRWFKTNNNANLVLAALSVSAMTLIRYEGLAILLSSVPMVFIYSWIKSARYKKAEADLILYSTLAFLGFGLWTLYLTAIFGDPLYWKNFYASSDLRQTYTGQVCGYTQNLSFINATIKYFTSVVWMSGLVPTLLGFIAILIMIFKCIRDKSWYFLPLLMPISIFLFMVLTLMRNTPIVQPALSIDNILSADVSSKVGFNIRYGILLLPWLAIMSSYLLYFKNIYIKVFLILIVGFAYSIQLYSNYSNNLGLIYKIPVRIEAKRNATLVDYMKSNYDGGLIFISASGHEDQMFEMGFNYSVFIHEGVNKYWKESLDDPPRYARWVIIDKGQNSDKIARKPNIEEILKRDYKLVFVDKQAQIYKIKKKPYFEI